MKTYSTATITRVKIKNRIMSANSEAFTFTNGDRRRPLTTEEFIKKYKEVFKSLAKK